MLVRSRMLLGGLGSGIGGCSSGLCGSQIRGASRATEDLVIGYLAVPPDKHSMGVCPVEGGGMDLSKLLAGGPRPEQFAVKISPASVRIALITRLQAFVGAGPGGGAGRGGPAIPDRLAVPMR